MYKLFDNFLEEHAGYNDFSTNILSQENQIDTLHKILSNNNKQENKYEFHLERNDIYECRINWNQNYCNEIFEKNNYFIFSITNFACQLYFDELFKNIIFPNSIQFLSISFLYSDYITEINGGCNFFPEHFKFPNVKYLRIYIKPEGYMERGFEGTDARKNFEREFYTSLLKREHFPKLVHLSINGLENHNVLFDCNVLSQLLVLDIRHVEGYYVKQRFYVPEDEYYIPTFISKLKEKSNNINSMNLKQLIIYCNIHQRYEDTLNAEALRKIYKSTADDCKFIFSISMTGIYHYCYSSCHE
ncbi:hypothetical protein ABK040_004088 [Willaertia magna]